MIFFFLIICASLDNLSMGDTGAETIVQEAAEQIGKIISENLTNGTNGTVTEKFKATPEGLILAYSSLVIMALIPIILGSFRSIHHQKNQKVSVGLVTA